MGFGNKPNRMDVKNIRDKRQWASSFVAKEMSNFFLRVITYI